MLISSSGPKFMKQNYKHIGPRSGYEKVYPLRRHRAGQSKRADFFLLVTEPTSFGLHDLKLAVGAGKTIGIPCSLVINRSAIGDDHVREYAKGHGMLILMAHLRSKKSGKTWSGIWACNEHLRLKDSMQC